MVGGPGQTHPSSIKVRIRTPKESTRAWISTCQALRYPRLQRLSFEIPRSEMDAYALVSGVVQCPRSGQAGPSTLRSRQWMRRSDRQDQTASLKGICLEGTDTRLTVALRNSATSRDCSSKRPARNVRSRSRSSRSGRMLMTWIRNAPCTSLLQNGKAFSLHDKSGSLLSLDEILNLLRVNLVLSK